MPGGPPRTILHVDLDAFFAAVEVREDPSLAGRPVVVGADPRGGRGRGVVAAASYEARAYGIHSAMPIGHAYRRCPTAAYLRPRSRLYAAASARFMAILARFTDLVEPLSIDEAFLDVTGSRALFGDGGAIARRIKDAVRAEERLIASVGVAPSKFLAKLASDLGKPDGLLVVPPDGIATFVRDVPVQRLWGAGPKSLPGFRRLGARTIGEVARLPVERLIEVFGEALGGHFHALACGHDPRLVRPDRQRKSVGRETTFAQDVRDRTLVERVLRELVEQVAHRLRRGGVTGRPFTSSCARRISPPLPGRRSSLRRRTPATRCGRWRGVCSPAPTARVRPSASSASPSHSTPPSGNCPSSRRARTASVGWRARSTGSPSASGPT